MKDVYASSDLGLSSALHCCGFEIERLDREDEKRVIFFFEGSNRIREVADAYWKGSLKLPAIKLFTSQKLLKQRIYAMPR